MAPLAHSKIGASSLKQKMMCPGSHLLGESLPAGPRKSSVFAAEGTLCHAISETCILTEQDPLAFLGTEHAVDGYTFTVTEEMVDGATLYVEHVRSLEAFGHTIELEKRVAPWWPWGNRKNMPVDLFGTCDCIALSAPGTKIEVVDLKYGRGVAVDAHMNPQLLYYAVGALSEMDPQARALVSSITITIVQPRAPHPLGPVRSFTLSRLELDMWASQVFRPAVERMLQPGQPFAAGEHCKFCPCKLVCPEIEKTAQDMARQAFDDDDAPAVGLSDAALADMAKRAIVLEGYIAAVQLELHERLVAGRDIPDFKLVAKRAARQWADSEAVLAAAAALGVSETITETKTSLLSPAQAETRLKKQKKDAWDVLAAHITKQSSGTTFAPVSDPRPAVPGRMSAEDAFTDD